jgi:uncharacterized protein (DUF1697 family)
MTYVALLRGINVGGKNALPMQELARMFCEAGCDDVQTYIQSGNVIFRCGPAAAKLPGRISSQIETNFGYRVPVIMRTAEQMAAVIKNNPFVPAGIDHKWLHVYFLANQPGARAVASLDPARSAPDTFRVRGSEIYLHLPNGMGRSKLTNAYFDSKLATTSTARNWSTILKLAGIMNGL